MAAKVILKPPSNVPGYGMTEIMKDVVRCAFSDVLTVSTAMSTDVELFSVPDDTMVLGVVAEVTTVFDGGSSDVLITVGDTTLATALFSMELSSLLAINTVGSLGKHYSDAQTIHAYFTPGEGVTGGLRFWLKFKTDSDVQKVG